jgi:Domain of unknown function (DUF4190)
MSRDSDDDAHPEVLPVRRERDPGDDPAVRMLLPVGRSGWAIAAGYLGLISVLCLPSPLALLAGILAVREMRRNPKKHGMGRAVFGILMGGIGTVALVVILIALAVGALTRR